MFGGHVGVTLALEGGSVYLDSAHIDLFVSLDISGLEAIYMPGGGGT
jgi:hypothetical protein